MEDILIDVCKQLEKPPTPLETWVLRIICEHFSTADIPHKGRVRYALLEWRKFAAGLPCRPLRLYALAHAKEAPKTGHSGAVMHGPEWQGPRGTWTLD